MKYVFSIAVVCLLSACLGGGSGSDTSVSTSSVPSVVPTAGESANFGSLLNSVRMSNGSGNVSYDARLSAAAQVHSNDQLSMGNMTHVGSDGSNAGQRIAAQGYNPAIWGENVARGQQTEADVMTAWTNSNDHHRNNINPVFEDFGIAKAGSGSQTYWTLVLATER